MSHQPKQIKRRLLVTSALPYANGPIHIGHLVEYIQTDIWVRFQRLVGNECLYFCADDAHGTAIMLKARELGIEPEELIERTGEEHLRDLRSFGVEFDHWHNTHSPQNQEEVEAFWDKITEKGLIQQQTITQLYDPKEKQFLSDRMVRGTCPHCKALDQYGDSCEVCGSSYEPSELIDPRSIFGSDVERRETEHLFFNLPQLQDWLRGWLKKAPLQASVANKIEEWWEDGLRAWDISRDEPYFGFAIPGHPGKFFYVWVDAPIGYIATSKAWAQLNGRDNQEFWGIGSDWELHHFIGKDIAYFHILFWPALLFAADRRLPTNVHCHGFLTFEGQKMSKSRGTLIEASQWRKHFDVGYLRYYLAAKLGGDIEDIDFSLGDFRNRVNADIVGKLFNIASRCVRLLQRDFGGRLSDKPHDELWLEQTLSKDYKLKDAYEKRNTNRMIRLIFDRIDAINGYLQCHRPWNPPKQDAARAQGILSDALCAFRAMAIWLSPILPEHSRRALELFGEELAQQGWEDARRHPWGIKLQPYKHIARRIDEKQVARFEYEVVEANAEGSSDKRQSDEVGRVVTSSKDPEQIDIDHFGSVDLRVARVLEANLVEGADRLLSLYLDVGGGTRTVLAGIRQWYTPEQLKGRLVVMVLNLKPRQTRFGLSEGMVLAATGEDNTPHLVAPDEGAKPGMRLR